MMIQNLLRPQLPFFIVLSLVIIYVAGQLGWLYWTKEWKGSKVKVVRLDTAEKGNVLPRQDLSERHLFDLEKRAFFSRVSAVNICAAQ